MPPCARASGSLDRPPANPYVTATFPPRDECPMALLEILQAPHPMLKTKAAPVGGVDMRLRQLAADMFETMYKAPGIGLAAPQIGVLERLVVMDVAEGEEREVGGSVTEVGAHHGKREVPSPPDAVTVALDVGVIAVAPFVAHVVTRAGHFAAVGVGVGKFQRGEHLLVREEPVAVLVR